MSDYCTGRLWLEGFEPLAKAFIEAMPAERRARFDRIVFAGPDAVEEQGHHVPEEHRERGIVYVVVVKGGRYAFVPVTRPFVEDVAAGGPSSLLRQFEWRLLGEEPAS